MTKIDPYRPAAEISIAESAIISFTTVLLNFHEPEEAAEKAIETARAIYRQLNQWEEESVSEPES